MAAVPCHTSNSSAVCSRPQTPIRTALGDARGRDGTNSHKNRGRWNGTRKNGTAASTVRSVAFSHGLRCDENESDNYQSNALGGSTDASFPRVSKFLPTFENHGMTSLRFHLDFVPIWSTPFFYTRLGPTQAAAIRSQPWCETRTWEIRPP
jgi:hypothetical protein